jgi:hypothetical protein
VRTTLPPEERLRESLELSGWHPQRVADGWTVAKGPISAWSEKLTPELVARLHRLSDAEERSS